MKIYFAGADAGIFREVLKEAKVKSILLSYYYSFRNKLGRSQEVMKKCYNEFGDIFIDSGGYTARRNDVNINVGDYQYFLEMNKDYISLAANLDVNEVDIALENQKVLEEAYPVLPVYHWIDFKNKRQDLLEEWCKKYKYIALGGIAGMAVPKATMKNFFNFCFRTIIKYKTKVHGFGICIPELLKTYPFYSVDSTSWLASAKFGRKFEFKNLRFEAGEEKIGRALAQNNYKFQTLQAIQEMLKLEQEITKLWKLRGINYV